MGKHKPVRCISREKAVFRLDKNGVWYVGDEKFTNQRIINYFHSVIKKDKDGYFLEQEHPDYIEKVYFPYEDTPLFVFRVFKKDGLSLGFNTGKLIALDPEKLVLKNDDLYIRDGGDWIKFNDDALLSLADHMDVADGQYVIDMNGKRHPIARVV